jgi:hypothetical protein
MPPPRSAWPWNSITQLRGKALPSQPPVILMISQMGLHATPQYRLIDLSWPDTSV